MGVEICRDQAGWDDYVNAMDGACNYHRWVWGDVIRQTYGHECFYLASRSGGQINGILPLVSIRSRLFGNSLVSVPFFSYGGVVSGDPEVREQLLARAVELGDDLNARHIEIRQGDACSLSWLEKSPKVTMEIALPATVDELWKRMTTGMRNKIRNARKNNLRVEWSGLEALGTFYKIFARNMRDLGTPTYPQAWFENLYTHLPEQTRFLTVWDGTEPVASGIITCFRDRVELPWSGSTLESRKKYSAVLMYWSVLEWAVENGYRQVDFGRCTRGSGTYEFKKHFGCQERPLHWYYWLSPGVPVPELRPDNPKFKLATSVWRRLPLGLANVLGPQVVRSIP